jgi:hypothetical protein
MRSVENSLLAYHTRINKHHGMMMKKYENRQSGFAVPGWD